MGIVYHTRFFLVQNGGNTHVITYLHAMTSAHQQRGDPGDARNSLNE